MKRRAMEYEQKVKQDIDVNEKAKRDLIRELMIKDADVFMPCLKTKSKVIINSNPQINSMIELSSNYGPQQRLAD